MRIFLLMIVAVNVLLVLMALSLTLTLLLFLLMLLLLMPPTYLQFQVLIVFRLLLFTPDLPRLLPIVHVSARIIAVRGILVNIMFLSYFKCTTSV